MIGDEVQMCVLPVDSSEPLYVECCGVRSLHGMCYLCGVR